MLIEQFWLCVLDENGEMIDAVGPLSYFPSPDAMDGALRQHVNKGVYVKVDKRYTVVEGD